MLVCEFNRPDAGSGANVEDLVRFLDGSSMQRAAETEAVDVVLQI